MPHKILISPNCLHPRACAHAYTHTHTNKQTHTPSQVWELLSTEGEVLLPNLGDWQLGSSDVDKNLQAWNGVCVYAHVHAVCQKIRSSPNPRHLSIGISLSLPAKQEAEDDSAVHESVQEKV